MAGPVGHQSPDTGLDVLVDEAVRVASVLLWPVIPGRMETLWPALGCDLDPSRGDLEAVAAWGDTLKGATTRKIALFPRVDPATTPAADAAS